MKLLLPTYFILLVVAEAGIREDVENLVLEKLRNNRIEHVELWLGASRRDGQFSPKEKVILDETIVASLQKEVIPTLEWVETAVIATRNQPELILILAFQDRTALGLYTGPTMRMGSWSVFFVEKDIDFRYAGHMWISKVVHSPNQLLDEQRVLLSGKWAESTAGRRIAMLLHEKERTSMGNSSGKSD